jgi:tripartite-type tricarboxylate transporter receptor subunit TctC
MDETALLLAFETMRNNPAYHAAEVLRRNTPGGSGAMAEAPEASEARGAVLLLISTWEVIAVLMDGVKRRDKIFEVTPVCHMYRELQAAIEALSRSIPGFGANFARLFAEYEAWLKKKKKDAKYISAACGGMHAKFG